MFGENGWKASQRKWLRYLRNVNPSNNFFIYEHWPKTDRPHVWQTLKDPIRGYIQHRSVLANEVVFEIDSDDTELVIELTLCIKQVLDHFGYNYFICDSGGRGTHTHTFWDFSDHLRKVSFKDLRMFILYSICHYAGLDNDDIGTQGETIDASCISFSENSNGHFIRTIGGTNQRVINNSDKKFVTRRKRICKNFPNDFGGKGEIEFPRRISRNTLKEPVKLSIVPDKKFFGNKTHYSGKRKFY